MGWGGNHHGVGVGITMKFGWESPWGQGRDPHGVKVGITKEVGWGSPWGWGGDHQRVGGGDHHGVWVEITMGLG